MHHQPSVSNGQNAAAAVFLCILLAVIATTLVGTIAAYQRSTHSPGVSWSLALAVALAAFLILFWPLALFAVTAATAAEIAGGVAVAVALGGLLLSR
ncbi:putative membrane protein [Streptacidiphilus sp. MAP12-16]|uniref:hypothetical protein n=1 Tax=Streptacidiphilus sp. MAP12-16 TaxID=3156300 RepID=UPI003517EE07